MKDVTALEATIQELAPNARGAALVPLFDGRASQWRIANWRAGRRGLPQWAVELLRAKIHADNERRAAIAAQLKAGPGSKAGARNLAEYLARRR